MEVQEPATAAAISSLAGRARAGDRDAFSALVGLATERARLYVRLRLGPALRASVEPDDVLQDGWAEAWRSIGSFEPRDSASFTRWVCRILENRIRDAAERGRAAKRSPGAAFETISQVAGRVAAPGAGTVTRAARTEEHARLVAAIDSLDAADRDVLLRRYFEDLTIDEIAAVTGIPATSVRRSLARSVERLGVLLGASS